ncbi:MAG: DNA polymerase-3 subunit gamma/tau, partial [Cryomorphaceae bacterium]
HIVSALSNALDSDRVHHAFLFTGTRGVGKTTLARIFAKALNCETGMSANPCGVCSACESVVVGNYIDLIEVDAASRTKVDDTRDLLDNVQYAPTQGRYKVYLIDEVHMLSTHSFNALLKTLEEPPEHVKFLLATTDPQKLPMTILSRCIQFSLNAIEQDAISSQLAHILEAEEITHESAALRLIARSASGSMRDALSLLDQAIAFGNGNVSEVALRDMLGMIDSNQIGNIISALIAGEYADVQQVIEKMVQKSSDFATAADDLLSMLHAISAYQFAPGSIEWKGFNGDEIAGYAQQLSAEQLQLYYQIVLHGKRDLHLAPDSRTGFEMAMLRLFAFTHKQKSGSQVITAPSQSEPIAVDQSVGGNQPVASQTTTETPAAANHQITEPQSADVKMASADTFPQLPDHLVKQHSDKVLTDSKPPLSPVTKLAKSTQTPALIYPLSEPSESIGGTSPNVQETMPTSAEVEPEKEINPVSINAVINNISAWSDMVNKLKLHGMTRQLVLHMSPQAYSNCVASVTIDSRYEQLVNKDRVAAIELQLNNACFEEVRLDVQLGDVDASSTVAGFNAEQSKQRTEDTRRSFQDDPSVQEMVALFDATVDVNSIKQA